MAKALHNLSQRKDKPFVAINCGALPDTLLESELFGYKAGAFTSAVRDKPGYFAVADGGTVLLDELGETSPAFQVKLLRVIEEREYQPLGSVGKQRTDVRIIAATNKNLLEMVKRAGISATISITGSKLSERRRRSGRELRISRCWWSISSKFHRKNDRNGVGFDEVLTLLIHYDYPATSASWRISSNTPSSSATKG